MDDRFAPFFQGIQRKGLSKECLLFTTFSLDEAVFTALLRKYNVPKNKRVVVFHDILRHRNPGFLRVNYPQSTVYSVILQGIRKRRVCPIFHSKVWARIDYSSKHPVLKGLAVGSLNLTNYHLVQRHGSGTFESFIHWDSSAVKNTPLPGSSFLFKRKLLFPGKKTKAHMIVKKPPSTIIILAKCGLLIDNSERKPVFDILKSNANKSGHAVLCAAPFISKTALKTAGIDEIDAYSNRDRDGHMLHAKVIVYEKTTILGSANLTAQALGTEYGVINHETIVISKRLPKPAVDRLRRFTRVDLNNCHDISPGDEDPEENLPHEYRDWIVERKSRIVAPLEATLVIDRDGKSAHIKFTGSPQASRVWIGPKSKPENGMYLSVKRSRKIAYPRRKREKEFARIISQGPAEIVKQGRGKISWKLDLNFGDYWPSLELRSRWAAPLRGDRGNGNDKSRYPGGKTFEAYDVRDLRQMAIKEPEKGRTLGPFARWLSHHGIIVADIPKWCDRVAEQLHKKGISR